MDAFLKFLMDNKDAIQTLLMILAFIGGLIGAFLAFMRWLLPRLHPAPVEIKAFDVITDPTTLLPKLYGEENNQDILAHHRIPYQRRDPDRDIQAELRAALDETRYLLITARTGIGKTREAAVLAASLMNEGWRIVRVKTGWLDAPKEFPSELGNDRRRILILLDDLNGLFRTGNFMQSPKAGQMPMFGQPSYRDRLLGFLGAFEKMCSENEIRVVATARDEADEWKTLNFGARDELWKRFKRIELPEPMKSAVVELLEESVARVAMKAERNDFPAIANKNDGTFANVVLNLQRAHNMRTSLILATFTPKLGETWQADYRRVCGKYLATRFIYDAIDVLRQVNIDLYVWLVEPTALILWGGNAMQKVIRRQQIHHALRAIVDENILATVDGKLAPRDGQIEAKGTEIDLESYITPLFHLMLQLASYHSIKITNSLSGFGEILYERKQFDQSLKLMQKTKEILTSHLDKAITLMEKVVQHLPTLDMLIFLAGNYKIRGNLETSAKYADKARALMAEDDWYNLICLEYIGGDKDTAFKLLRQAIERAELDRTFVWKAPNSVWIRDDPRFREIVGPPPDIGGNS